MEYTEEEKKAFETLEYFEPDDLVECSIYLKSIKTIKKLIEKQQNEIERLYKDNYRLDIENQKLFEDTIENYISKEEIREKIENITKNVIQNAGENWEKDVYSAKAIVNALNNLLKE